MSRPAERRPPRPGFAPARAAIAIAGAGAAVVCMLAAVIATLLDNVLDGDGLTVWDGPISTWTTTHREPAITTVMRALTALGNPPVLAMVMAITMGVTAFRARSLAPVILGAVAYGGFGLMVVTVKLAVGRPRPPLPERAIAIDGSSFPSGHATGIAVVALMSAWLLTRGRPENRRTHVTVWVIAVALIVAVGFSRVYLGVHYPSDIIGGWALGVGWAGVLIVSGTVTTPLWWGVPVERRRCRS